jgi:hypothetical protein
MLPMWRSRTLQSNALRPHYAPTIFFPAMHVTRSTVLLCAFLTLNAMRISFYKLATFDRANSLEVLMVKSLRGLQLPLSGFSIAGGGERIILDIFFLAFSEFYCQNYEVMRMHLKMTRRLVPLLGGFSGLCQYVREACCYTELCFAVETG